MATPDAQTVMARAGSMREFSPSNPVEMEFFIRESNELLETMPDVLLELNERRYAAEREYSRVKHTKLAEYGGAHPVTIARSMAEVDALDAKEAWDAARTAWHYAEDCQKALTTKIYSLLNINKATTVAYQSYGRGGQ